MSGLTDVPQPPDGYPSHPSPTARVPTRLIPPCPPPVGEGEVRGRLEQPLQPRAKGQSAAERVVTPSAGQEIFVRKKINFCAHENLFSSEQKFGALRTEILPLTEGAFFHP